MKIKARVSLLFALITNAVVSVQANEHPREEAGHAIPIQDCVMQPSEIVDVGSAIPGVVDAIHVYRSDRVEKGTVIVELESSVERASLELARIRAGMDTAIELHQERAEFGSLTEKRMRELLRKSAISQHDVDQSKTEARIAELQVRQQQDEKALAELEYHRAKMILMQRSIRSPVAGVVMERFKSVGEFVENDPLVRVAQLDPLHVEVIVPVDYWEQISPGMEAEVSTGYGTSAEYRATVERVDRVADAASGTFGVRLSLPNPDYQIPAGLRCQLSFLPPSLDEPEQVAEAAESGAPVEVADEYPPESCYSIGPVEDEATAQGLAERLEQATEKLQLRSVSNNVTAGYQVLAVEPSNSQDADELLARLDQAGITDRFVLAGGEHKGRVGLGYFSKRAFAEKRQDALGLLGFETELLPDRKDVQEYWLEMAVSGKTDLSDQLQNTVAALDSTATFKPMACYPELAER
ncbi:MULTISPECIES: efflux RND transporter periplasmic adaptor subunit [Marinobacter]|uniref:Efflux RND transporter periplasmic adaptor subunit n=1 Tax=Marinobacter suaedae TaxID=3057675 RepID=A0ABT8VZF2_9GAMM|nr:MULTISPECIES: efflux RND transporter periplasmic adaptor subunit [unclassified Marinobacter]MBZ2169516.1 efflux RND transporter periplasmic adaptor subunit [Marinobacter sp. F4216]MDO3721350.1 efflux RND transporter periplasmic adaptor subunit [Marinobacter sp. chi1]